MKTVHEQNHHGDSLATASLLFASDPTKPFRD